LYDCWFGGIYDIDIARAPQTSYGALNDRTRYFEEEPELNLTVSWSDTNKGEVGCKFGYIGVAMLETPATDDNGFIRNDKLIFEPNEQIGLKTSINWAIEEDPKDDTSRYNFISRGNIDGDLGPGDKRALLGSGPFNMRPGDVARVVFATVLAKPAKGGEADGTYEDLTGFVEKTNKDMNPKLQSNKSLVSIFKNTRDKYYQYAQTDVDDNVNSGFNIKEVYPNPVNHFFNIDYNLENAGNVIITINDESGKEAGLLFDGWKDAGNQIQNVSIDKNKLSAGVYFIRLQTANQIRTKKIVIVK
jgi:hypothetical protein